MERQVVLMAGRDQNKFFQMMFLFHLFHAHDYLSAYSASFPFDLNINLHYPLNCLFARLGRRL